MMITRTTTIYVHAHTMIRSDLTLYPEALATYFIDLEVNN
jgi:hypothetical protein